MATQTQIGLDLTNVTDLATIVGRTDKEFTDGVCSGYLTYYDEYQGKPITDLNVYTFIIQNITHIRGNGYDQCWLLYRLDRSTARG